MSSFASADRLAEVTCSKLLSASFLIERNISLSAQGASVHTVAAGIIAADFTAVPTDSPLQVAVAQRLPAASQQC